MVKFYRVRVESADENLNRKWGEHFFHTMDAAYEAREKLLDNIIHEHKWYSVQGVNPLKIRVEYHDAEGDDLRFMRVLADAKVGGLKYTVQTPWIEVKTLETED